VTSLPQPVPQPGSGNEPDGDRVYSAVTGRHLTGGAARQAKQHIGQHAEWSEIMPNLQALAQAQIRAMGGPDALRRQVGRDTALGLVAFAFGEGSAQQAASTWNQQDNDAPRQFSAAFPGPDSQGFAGDPLHDPRVVRILGRVSANEEAAVIREVTREYAAAAAARERARKERELPSNLAHGPISSAAMQPAHVTGGNAPAGARWNPLTHRMEWDGQQEDMWSREPDHQPGFLQRAAYRSPGLGGSQMPVPREIANPQAAPPAGSPCNHRGMAHARYCQDCGTPMVREHWQGSAGESAGQVPPPITEGDDTAPPEAGP
jgi:hypothetical protein